MKKLLALALLLFACKGGPPPRPEGSPEITAQELTIAAQGLTDFTLKLDGQVTSPVEATLEKAVYELVVEGKVVKSGEQPLGIAVTAGQTAPFSVEHSSRYVASPEELEAMSARGGSLLAALRGKLLVRSGGKSLELPFARSRQIRVPRLPSVKLHELDAARFSAEEANIVFYLGVVNPNPFPIGLDGLTYEATLAGKKLSEGNLGRGDEVSAAATGVFEVAVALNQETYGAEVTKLIKGLKVPYVVKGALKGDLFELPYELTGEIQLRASK